MLLVSMLAGGTPPRPPQASDQPDKAIVVTARSSAQTAQTLATCLSRQCPPSQDIDASIAHAENLFLGGDYASARRVLRQSYGRNVRYAKQEPIAVSDLARAYGRISVFDGHSDVGRILQIDSLDTLKAGLDHGDARVLKQRLMVADEFVRQGRLRAGDDIYAKVARQAERAKQPIVQGTAMLRRAVIYSALASVNATYTEAARHRLNDIEQTTAPEMAPYRDAVPMVRATIAALEGNDAKLEKVMAELASKKLKQPILIYNPAIERVDRPTDLPNLDTPGTDGRPQWIDVTFDIGLDGRVSNFETLRQTDTVRDGWPSLVRDAVTRRRYAPLDPATNPALLRRVERFSMVHYLSPITRSRIRKRTANGRIVSLDLTNEPSPIAR